MRDNLLIVLFLLSLLGCSAFTPPPTPEKPVSLKPLVIGYTGDRFLEIDTCDCALKQLGGVHREYNALQKWRASTTGKLISASSGTTFVPPSKKFKRRRLELYERKAEFLIQAMNVFDVSVLSPSSEDFVLGIETLRRLESKAIFPFVSTNIYSKTENKPVFRRFTTVDVDDYEVLFLGLASPPSSRYGDISGISVIPPQTALDDVFRSLKEKKPRFVVILSSLSESQNAALVQQYPQINLLLGAKFSEKTTFGMKQLTGSALYVNPAGEGRTMSFVQFQMKLPLLKFYNERIAGNIQERRRIWQRRLLETIDLLNDGQERNAEDQAEIENKQTEFSDYLKRTSTVPKESSAQTILYEGTTVELGDVYEEPKNILSDLIKRYRAANRQAAAEDFTVMEANP